MDHQNGPDVVVVKIVVLALGTPDMRRHVIFRNQKGATNLKPYQVHPDPQNIEFSVSFHWILYHHIVVPAYLPTR